MCKLVWSLLGGVACGFATSSNAAIVAERVDGATPELLRPAETPRSTFGLPVEAAWEPGAQLILTGAEIDLSSTSHEEVPVGHAGFDPSAGVWEVAAAYLAAGIRLDGVQSADKRGVPEIIYTAPPIPEPATWIMITVGFAAFGGAMRRHRAQLKLA